MRREEARQGEVIPSKAGRVWRSRSKSGLQPDRLRQETESEPAEEGQMAKGNKRCESRESKKPKQEKPKAAATATLQSVAKGPILGSKKVR